MYDSADQSGPVSPTAPSPGEGVFPGERATTVRSFATGLADIAPQLPDAVWKSLFQQTSGHLLAGQAVLQGADSMGYDLSAVDADHYSDLPSADVLTQIRRQAPDSPELRFAHLLSFMRDINADTLAIAAGAMPHLGSFSIPNAPEGTRPFDVSDLSAHLNEDGLLLPVLDRTGHHTIAPVVRTILRRLYDARDRHSESRSRRALGASAAEWLQAPAAYHSEGFDEALLRVAEAGEWNALTELWANRGHALMVDHFDATLEAFSKVPEAQAHNSAVLAEALGDCLQVDEVRRRLGVNDALTVLKEVNFEHAAVPTLDSQLERIKDGDFTVDDIMIMAIASMRRQKLLGRSDQGLHIARAAQELINDTRHLQSAATPLCEARFHLEYGITSMFVGDLTGSAQLLRRSIILTELASASSPYLLLPAHAYSALAHAMLGNGPSSDVHLRHFDELKDRARFTSPHTLTAYSLARMIRAMDALDLDEASQYSTRLADPALGHHSWLGVVRYRSLFGILRSDVGIEGKRLQQAIDANRSSLPADGLLLHTLQLTLVCLHLAQGQTHLAQNVLLDAETESPYIILARAQLHLTIGEHGTAAHLANRVLSQNPLDLHAKAAARAVQAAGLLGKGELVESDSAFVDALEYCRIAASLIPVAMVPKSLRDQLIERSSSAAEWDLIAPVFPTGPGTVVDSGSADGPGPTGGPGSVADPSSTDGPGSVEDLRVGQARFGDGAIGGPGGLGAGEQLRQRLLSLGETLRIRAGHTLLSPSQRQLLALLDTQSSVSAIAAELSLVEGTVKNKLSNLYARLGVRNRRDALARGYEYGYLPTDR
ncbi:response regulator transcription factor [Brevibacterium sp. UCMA 11754]|uniref:response regulator transcription factor n=1 Tax=Brevibacterium sp. UCMA 11754 TaxID=2749198 RepID=UPI001F271215|nr:helix-turn-helix transcriptional regulator [Brevibacterium sp. UCMA 11754]MCF2572200.1 helix-turn-helix transcriptional regulator [Brevibacterium sp. UCMA 11754]